MPSRTCSALAILLPALLAPPATAQVTERVSVGTGGVQGNSSSLHSCSITPDGRFVAFQSEASNLVAGDTNSSRDIFVRDRVLDTTVRASVSTAGAEGNDWSLNPAISADGRFVVFESYASNLVTGDTNSDSDVFLRDRATNTTKRVSVSSAGTQGNLASVRPAISADGRFIAFISRATTLVPIANDVQYHVFLHERTTGATSLVATSFAGGLENGTSSDPTLSADGRFIAFVSTANNLLPAQSFGFYSVYVRDRVLGTTVMASVRSVGGEGNGWSLYPTISASGTAVAFQSDATDLVPGDTNGFNDVFVRDLALGVTDRVSVSSGGVEGNSPSGGTGQPPGLSADGRFVTFSSYASNLAPGWAGWNAIYVRDRALAQTAMASVATGGAAANDASLTPAMSSDGRYALFQSLGSNLVPGDTNGTYDVFLRGPFPSPWTNLGKGTAGVYGVPNLLGAGTLAAGAPGSLALSSARPATSLLLFTSAASTPATVQCGTLVPLPYVAALPAATDALGAFALAWPAWPAGLSGATLYFQHVLADPAAICGASFSNALRADCP